HSMSIVAKDENSIFDGLDMQALGFFDITAQAKTSQEEPHSFLPIAHYGRQDKESQPKESSSEIDFGNAMHFCLEMLYGFEAQKLESAIDAMVNRFGNLLSDENIKDIESRVGRLIVDSRFQELLMDSSYYKEIAMVHNQRLMIIDLLIENESEYIVVDYKSSSKNQEEHIAQVGAYISAIKATTHKEARGYICYLLVDSVEIQEII
ncbi:MAG: PD-(D/E)XK nuclease family protein, partial [Campylobacterota bacterium]|nr:PD-(D/E)XK nuclease family protein [Campylobacterota bacterium]